MRHPNRFQYRSRYAGADPRYFPARFIPSHGQLDLSLSYSALARGRAQLSQQQSAFRQFGRMLSSARTSLFSKTDNRRFLPQAHSAHSLPSLFYLPDAIKALPGTRAVSFDLYNTLVGWSSSQAERHKRFAEIASTFLLTRFRLPTSTSSLTELAADIAWRERWEKNQALGIEIKLATTLKRMLDLIIELTGSGIASVLAASSDEIVDEFETLWYKVELETALEIPGAVQAIKSLKEMGLKIGITSNASWTVRHVERVLRRFKILNHIDSLSISSEFGKMKHEQFADFFHYSWESQNKLSTHRSHVVHVGDSLTDDYVGAINAGARAIIINDASNFINVERNAIKGKAYSRAAIATQRRSLTSRFAAYLIDSIQTLALTPAEKDRLAMLSFAIYRKTRDVIGPAYVVLSHELLRRTESENFQLCLCLGRDAIPMAILQKLLLRLAPESYPRTKSHQIKYLHVSRDFIVNRISEPDFRSRFVRYLEQRGIESAQRLLLTDIVCMGGSLHSGLRALFPYKTIEGLYMYSPKNRPATEGSDVRSFINDVLGVKPYGVHLEFDNMLLLFEALFSGPHESARDLKLYSNRIFVDLVKKKPGDIARVRGLTSEGIAILNQVALRGLRDAAIMLHRRRLLGEAEDHLEIVKHFHTFISSAPTAAWRDIWLSVPWSDAGFYMLAEQNPVELTLGGIAAGKI
jgi:FMN phosphatase YigB (HAD superfamily)